TVAIGLLLTTTATTALSTLSLHDALPISSRRSKRRGASASAPADDTPPERATGRSRERADCDIWPVRDHEPQHTKDEIDRAHSRSEEHTSELQSLRHLVCRLLLEKKKHN